MKELNSWVVELFGKLKQYGIQQNDLAKEMGVSVQWVSDVLNGKREAKNSEAEFNKALKKIIEERTEKNAEA